MQTSALCPTPRLALNSNGRSPVTDSGPRETAQADRPCPALPPLPSAPHPNQCSRISGISGSGNVGTPEMWLLLLWCSPRFQVSRELCAIIEVLAWHQGGRRETSQKSPLVQSEVAGTRKQIAKRNTGVHRPKLVFFLDWTQRVLCVQTACSPSI